MTIAFVGTGTMGGPMLANLVTKGFAVTAYDVVPAALERAVQAGAKAAGSAAEAARGAELVVTMLPSSSHVETAYFGKGGPNPWGGVEAILTHLISSVLDVPSAHAPTMSSEALRGESWGVVEPRKAMEIISTTYLFCVLKGLNKAPHVVVGPTGVYDPSILTAEDVSALVIPDGCAGLPTLAAVDAFPGRAVVVIVGGQVRGIDYGPLVDGLTGRKDPTLVAVVESEAAPRIRAAFDAHAAFAPDPGELEVVDVPDLDAAAWLGHDWARPDGVVLLSPAAPSFDRFRDYRDRAAAFATAVDRLGARRG